MIEDDDNIMTGLDIGVDLDGVLYDFGKAFRGQLHGVGYDTTTMAQPTSWTFYEDWGLTREQFQYEVSRGVDDGYIFAVGDPATGAREVLERLRSAGHRVHIITDRASFGSPGEAQSATVRWLGEHDIPYDSLTFSADKTVVRTHIMIDDRLENYRALDETACIPILLDQPWNQDPDALRVHSLKEFADMVERIHRGIFGFYDSEACADDGCDCRCEDEVAQFLGHSVADDEGTKESILQEADRLVSGERGGDYGHPFDDFSRTAKMWSAIFGIDVRPEQVPLAMICVKVSREVNKPKRDNVVDIAGYAKTLDMVNERRRELDDAASFEWSLFSDWSVPDSQADQINKANVINVFITGAPVVESEH